MASSTEEAQRAELLAHTATRGKKCVNKVCDPAGVLAPKSKKTNDVIFIDASAEFTRTGNKNKLSPAKMDNILEALDDRGDDEHFAKVVADLEGPK